MVRIGMLLADRVGELLGHHFTCFQAVRFGEDYTGQVREDASLTVHGEGLHNGSVRPPIRSDPVGYFSALFLQLPTTVYTPLDGVSDQSNTSRQSKIIPYSHSNMYNHPQTTQQQSQHVKWIKHT